MNEPQSIMRARTVTLVAVGPANAGKATLLGTLAAMRPATAPARILDYRLREGRVLSVELNPVRLEDALSVRPRLMTLSGSVASSAAWTQLLGIADVALFVADARPGRSTSNADAYSALRSALAQLTSAGVPPVVLMVARTDEPEARTPAETIASLAVQGPHFSGSAREPADLVPVLAESIVRGVEDLEGRVRPASRDLVARQLLAFVTS